MDFSTWIVAGLMIIVGSILILVFNADVALGLVMRTFGRIRSLTPGAPDVDGVPARRAIPHRYDLAMFTLVVFTLVTGTASNGSFVHAIGVDDFGGGFQVRAGTTGTSPIDDMAGAAPDARRRRQRVHGRRQPVGARRGGEAGGSRAPFGDVPRPGARRLLPREYHVRIGRRRPGLRVGSEVWAALTNAAGLAVVDSTIVPRRDNWAFGVLPDFQLSGFYYEEGDFRPTPIEVVDEQTGQHAASDRDRDPQGHRTARDGRDLHLGEDACRGVPRAGAADDPLLRARARRRSGRRQPDSRPRSSRAGSRPSPSSRSSRTSPPRTSRSTRLIQGFLGLGLLVGVAALGVISARAVVERRQQIGVMRAIGFRRGRCSSRSCSSPRSSR